MDGSDARRELAEAMTIEEIGIGPVPDESRDATARQQLWIWMGVNLSPLNWVVGTFGIVVGLSLLETILVMVIGQAVGALIFGCFALMGHKTGVNQMVLARATFGRIGAYIPAALQVVMGLGFVGVNTYLILQASLGICGKLGIETGGVRYPLAAGFMLVQMALAVLGFYAIRTFEKFVVPVITGLMVIMTVLVLTKLGDVNWTASSLNGSEKFTAMTQLMTAVGIGWGISWIAWASDTTRFTTSTVPRKRLFAATSFGMFISLAWLSVLGALAASAAGDLKVGDPLQIVSSLFGIAAIPVLMIMLLAPVGSNVLNIYSASLGLMSLDVKVSRTVGSVLAGLASFVPLIFFIRSESLEAAFTNFMLSMVVWLAPWAGVTLVDHYVIRRQETDVSALYESGKTSRYRLINFKAVTAFLLGLAAAWSWQLGMHAAFQGPLAKATGNVDLSWAAGLIVSAASLYLMHLLPQRSPAAYVSAGTARAEV